MAEPDILTIDEILRAGEREFDVPSYPGKKIRLRKVSGPEYATTVPAAPPDSLTWPEDGAERKQAEVAWLVSLTEEQLERRRQGFADSDYRLIALASVSPKLTVEDARRLGHDAAVLAQQLLEFSLPKKKE